MTNVNIENEQAKRGFFEYLKGAKGFTESSVRAFAGAIGRWQEFSQNDDFGNFNKSKAVGFVEWLEKRPTMTDSGKLSAVTRDNYLRRVKPFFEWLAGQPGYKTKIAKNEVEYLRLSNSDAQAARAGTTKTMPTLDEAKRIIESIEVKNEVDRRDRALISLALITGMRIDAIVSLRMKSFVEQERKINQNPGDGVRTKNSKPILTTLFPIGWDSPERYFLEWYDYLKAKGFGPEDPIFPSTQSGFGEKGGESSKDSVSRGFWKGTGGARKIFEQRCIEAGVPYYNPHSFRHLIVSLVDKMPLTEEQKKAISLNLGHANVGTTFGSYGYGNMSNDDALKIVQKLGAGRGENEGKLTLSKEERAMLEGILQRSL